jgi:hypothetical protein
MMNRFIKYLLVGSAVALIAILGTQRLLVDRVRARMNEAGRFEDSVRRAIEHDARFANITFEGVSWSGFGHPVYIPVSGTVRSREDWVAFSNLVFQAHPPVEIILSTVKVDAGTGESKSGGWSPRRGLQ